METKKTMFCGICGKTKLGGSTNYDDEAHLGLRLLRYYDRKQVCHDCHNRIIRGLLLVSKSQLTLPRVYHSVPLGLFTTQKYLAKEHLADYTGDLITDWNVVKKSKSAYIINRFVGTPPMKKRSWIDGKNCIGKFCIPFCLFFFIFKVF